MRMENTGGPRKREGSAADTNSDQWRESVRGLWTRGISQDEIKGILLQAEEADRKSATALQSAHRTISKVYSRSRKQETASAAGAAIDANDEHEISPYENTEHMSKPGTGFSSRTRTSRVNGARGRGSRPHSAMDSVIFHPHANAEMHPQEEHASSRDPEEDLSAPFAAPFRSASATLLTTGKRPRRPQSTNARPYQFGKPIHEDMGVEERLDAMLHNGSTYHRMRTDITSPFQTRAGLGKKQNWLATMTFHDKLNDVQPRAIQDFVERKQQHAAYMNEIKEAALIKPKPVPITFEPLHSALP
jgi:hypothetical protein